MGQQYLTDSNSVIDYLGGKLPSTGMDFISGIVNHTHKISVITKIEVLGYNTPTASYQLLNDFVESSILLELTSDVINQTIVLRKALKIKIPDAIIAATALVFNLTLITRNENDFQNIPGLKLLNPWNIK